MRVAIMTGGGDCPGLNACIRAIVRTCLLNNIEPVGSRNGWLGFMNEDLFVMDIASVSDIIDRGGTILGTSRINPVESDERFESIRQTLEKWNIECIIVIGGNGTLAAANEVAKRYVNIIGVPKTIDNDINGTDKAIGFDTAINIVTEALDRLHSTAESHHRTMVMEVMGRDSGWIAVAAGIAGAADCIVIPEKKITIDEIESCVRSKYNRGKKFSLIVFAEGANIDGLPEENTAKALSEALQKRTGFETRFVDIGHVQRGGTPTAADRIIATRLGVTAVDEAIKRNYGIMIGIKGDTIVTPKLAEIVGEYKNEEAVEDLYNKAKVFFG